jgi:hypothetical protein
LSRLRWLILIIGPLPIVGSSWALSAWFKPEPSVAVVRNDVWTGPLIGLFSADGGRRRPAEEGEEEERPDLDRACRHSAARLKEQLGPQCGVIVLSPLVIGGDLGREELADWHTSTIRPAMRAMQGRYFRTAPTQPITVLLFRGEQSYNRHAQLLFGESGISIYGYYKPNVRTLLLNLETGTGTLLHELTHALMDFDFPDAPDWLNEGLASLHEQCRFRGGDGEPWLEGLVNWRLDGLQEVIRQGRLRPLAALFEDAGFRGPLEGTNYAQARYFCLYLQRQGLLEKLYRSFRDDHAGDARGLTSIGRLIPDANWQKLDQDFQRWVLALPAGR